VPLGPHVGDVDVHAGMHVVKQIPAHVVGILIDHEIIAAVPAPIRAHRPVPWSYFKIETTRQPEAVMIAIEAFDAVAIRWAEMLEASVLERMVSVESLVVRTIVAVPVAPFRARQYSLEKSRSAGFASGPRSGVTVSVVRRPSNATPQEIQSDQVAVVLKFVAIDNLSGQRDFIFQGSDLRHVASLPRAGGNDAGAMNTDVIGIRHLRAVGRLMLRRGEAHNYRDR
jgi:hypothetical protein